MQLYRLSPACLCLYWFLLACGSHPMLLRLQADTARAPMEGQYIIDDSRGPFKALTFTSGPLKHFAHNHIFMVRHFSGNVQFDPATTTPASLQIAIKTDSLDSVDDLDAHSRQIINGEVRGQVLEAKKYPEITFTSTHVTTSPGSLAGHYTAEMDGDLTLHGATHPHHITADVSTAGHWLHASGVLRVRQTDYNMKPQTLLGGLIRVNDEVHLVFDIAAYQPVQLTGKVAQYYADCAGFASAVELTMSTGNSQRVSFHPSLGQRLIGNYPVGSEATLWIQENSDNGNARQHLIGWKKEMTISDFQPPDYEKGTTWLESQPWVSIGAKYETIHGRLARALTGSHGETVALVIDRLNPDNSANNHHSSLPFVVIVPPEMRQVTGEVNRNAALFPGTVIEATGLPVAPRAGAVSLYAGYLSATAIVINGKSAGATTFSQQPHPPACASEPMFLPHQVVPE